ncbi:hypothetical protein [Fervidobacterium gondwanense]|uniref:hypothetical protein n=1 Tax=Fervidobacterium gondwanense TaxID=44754 RepID=UPI003A60B300
MLKQMIQFSHKLKESGFYDNQINDSSDDSLYIIVPLESKKDIHFVAGTNVYNELVRHGISSCRSINDVEDEFKKILLSVEKLTKKLPGDDKGNKSIGSNKGVNSYNLLIFNLPKDNVKEKILKNYSEKGLRDVSTDFSYLISKEIIESLKLSNEEAEIIVQKVESFLNELQRELGEKQFKKVVKPNAIYVIFKSSELISKNIYEKFHQEWKKKKIFSKEESRYIHKGTCPVCGQSGVELSIPGVFHTMNDKKPFITHLGRNISPNTLMCRDCSLELADFYTGFLSKINIFPLFVNEQLEEREINILKSLFKTGERIERSRFRDILKEVAKEFEYIDFYLIVRESDDFVFFDYVSNFRYYFVEGVSVFDIESDLDILFDGKLRSNYFSSTDDGDILAYRSQIFDFVYRAKYESLNLAVINEIFYNALKKKLRSFLENSGKNKERNEERIKIENILKMFDIYKRLNRVFGGVYMEKSTLAREIMNKEELERDYEFYYLLGKITYSLLSQSESATKTHALVEPFINVSSSAVMLERVVELFNKYKHKIDIDDYKFNKAFSLVLSYYNNKLSKSDNQQVSRENKFYFFEGYFTTARSNRNSDK